MKKQVKLVYLFNRFVVKYIKNNVLKKEQFTIIKIYDRRSILPVIA